MIITKELASLTIPVDHYWSYNVVTEEPVTFTVFHENERFRAVPLMSKEERNTTGLPEELLFVYLNYCIAEANDMEEETLKVIKELILELKVQELI